MGQQTLLERITEKLVQRFTDSPEVRRLVEQEEQAERTSAIETRETARRQFKEATAEDFARIEATKQALEPLTNRRDALQAQLDALNEEITAVRLKDRQQYWQISRRIDGARATLEANVQPEVAPFLERLEAEHERVSHQYDSITEPTIDGRKRVTWHNSESVRARMEALHEARRRALKLVFEPLEGAAVEAALEAIWDALPAVETRPFQDVA